MSRVLRECDVPLPAAGESGARWFEPLRDWPRALQRALELEPSIVRIVLAEVRGSAPREPGAGMLVGRGILEGTIGGGALEWQAVRAARSMLAEAGPPVRVQRLVLGPELAQCCGGAVQLWIERHTRAAPEWLTLARRAALRGAAVLSSTWRAEGVARDVLTVDDALRCADVEALAALRAPASQVGPRLCSGSGSVRLLERLDGALPPLWLFGAGHVGQALARILVQLPLDLTWLDARTGMFPADPLPALRMVHLADPVRCLETAPAGTRFIVLTHSHPLDYALCRAILERGDSAWLGLIGSASKAARFRSRLARDGLSPAAVARLVCPIGIDGIRSKWPGAIAVAVAAQLLQDLALATAAPPRAIGVTRSPGGGCTEAAGTDVPCTGCQPHPGAAG